MEASNVRVAGASVLLGLAALILTLVFTWLLTYWIWHTEFYQLCLQGGEHAYKQCLSMAINQTHVQSMFVFIKSVWFGLAAAIGGKYITYKRQKNWFKVCFLYCIGMYVWLGFAWISLFLSWQGFMYFLTILSLACLGYYTNAPQETKNS